VTIAPPDNDVLWARALVKSHRGTPALRGVSLGVREGEVLAVTGPRGSGKSTLLDCLSGLASADEGEVWFNSAPVHTLGRAARERLRRERFGYVGPEPQLVPELTARENVALPLLLSGAPRKEAVLAATEWLERLDVADCARLRPADLRQDQRQRVAVARALAHRPTVVFADEPTAPLHRADRDQVLRILVAASRSHRITLVLATHDPGLARYADRVATMADGRLSAPVLGRPAMTVRTRPADEDEPRADDVPADDVREGDGREGDVRTDEPHEEGVEQCSPTSV
jgi:putative ABC transport system ATP-binding protein